ncbi:MAG: dCTP deaminase [bacterium]|nr:dCTP deaminase [bacterium]
MILTKKEIIQEIKNKNISISPLNKKNIGPASIDLTLADEFRVFLPAQKILLTEATDAEKFTKKITQKQIILQPGDFVLAKTKEKITLPENICGLLSGRSRFARIGLLIDVTAFFIHPGVSNHQIFEIKNISHNEITLTKGLKIAQLIFIRTNGKAKYNGKFKNQ